MDNLEKLVLVQEEFEDTEGIIRISKLKKNRKTQWHQSVLI